MPNTKETLPNAIEINQCPMVIPAVFVKAPNASTKIICTTTEIIRKVCGQGRVACNSLDKSADNIIVTSQ